MLIVNKSCNTGEILEDWKNVNVVPVFTKGKLDDPDNYRLVSLTSILGIIMES